MAKVVEVMEPSDTPEEYSGFDRLEVREYENTGTRHLYGVNEVDGKKRSTHLKLGELITATAGVGVTETLPTAYEAQLEALKTSMAEMQEKMDEMSKRIDNLTAERDGLREENLRLEEELAEANRQDTNFEDDRTFREKASDFFHGRSMYTTYRFNPVREKIVEFRDDRPRVALVAGILAVGAFLLYKNMEGSGGLSEEQAQTLIDQNTEIINNQRDSLKIWDPNGSEDGTAFTTIEDRIENFETILDPNGPEETGDALTDLKERVEYVEGVVDPNGTDAQGDSFSELEERVHELEAKMTGQHTHAHKHELDAINGVLQQNNPDMNGLSGGIDTGSSDSGSEHYEKNSASRTESLEYYGDTISQDVKSRLTVMQGYAPSDKQIIKATQKVLDINNLNWDSARHLPVGYSYKMPSNLLELANR